MVAASCQVVPSSRLVAKSAVSAMYSSSWLAPQRMLSVLLQLVVSCSTLSRVLQRFTPVISWSMILASMATQVQLLRFLSLISAQRRQVLLTQLSLLYVMAISIFRSLETISWWLLTLSMAQAQQLRLQVLRRQPRLAQTYGSLLCQRRSQSNLRW